MSPRKKTPHVTKGSPFPSVKTALKLAEADFEDFQTYTRVICGFHASTISVVTFNSWVWGESLLNGPSLAMLGLAAASELFWGTAGIPPFSSLLSQVGDKRVKRRSLEEGQQQVLEKLKGYSKTGAPKRSMDGAE